MHVHFVALLRFAGAFHRIGDFDLETLGQGEGDQGKCGGEEDQNVVELHGCGCRNYLRDGKSGFDCWLGRHRTTYKYVVRADRDQSRDQILAPA